MNKEQFVELIQHELTGGNMSPEMMAKYDKRVLEKRVANYFDLALLGIWLQMKASKDFSSFDTWSKFYKNVPVQLDNDRNEYYSNLPATLSSIPLKIALREVRLMKSPESAMPIMESGANAIFAVLDTGKPERSCFLDGNRIYYANWDNFNVVGMRLVVSFDSYDDDDEIPLPITMKGTMFDLLIQSLRGVQATVIDKINDNA